MVSASAYAFEDSELEELAPLVAWAFGGTPASSFKWLQGVGSGSVRVLRDGGRLRAGLAEISMGQWFGGQRVEMLGVAGVAVAAEARGGGLARRLMVEMLQAARARRVALSTLFPATVTLYRNVGYELAGSRYRYTAPLARLPRWRSELALDPLPASREGEVEAMYRELAREQPGYLDRGSYVWNRVRAPEGAPVRGLLVEGAHGTEGYVYVKQQITGEWSYDLVVTDLVAKSGDAAKRILTFLADHRSTGSRALWHAGPLLPWTFEFPDRVFEVALADYWMLRVVHAEAALEQRGYPKALTAELDLEVEDPVLPENSGRYLVRLVDGRAAVERALGAGRIRIDTRGLAALYTGFATPAALVRARLLSASADDLGLLGTAFGSGAPGLVDHF
jgi:predicted acetyltransferase